MGRVDIFNCAENRLTGLCAGWSRSIDCKDGCGGDESQLLIIWRGHSEIDLVILPLSSGVIYLLEEVIVYRCSEGRIVCVVEKVSLDR